MRSWERAKGLTRIEFVAGGRALADYRKANRTAREIAALFSTGRDDAPQHASQVVEENKELHRRVRALEEVEARVEAERLLASALVQPDGTRVVSHVFGGVGSSARSGDSAARRGESSARSAESSAYGGDSSVRSGESSARSAESSAYGGDSSARGARSAESSAYGG